jgi:predicted RNase H-like nuclease (RuvC/YqgF family)
MLNDHNERMKSNHLIHSTVDSLMKKLEERDETIEMLRYELKRLKSKLGYNHE